MCRRVSCGSCGKPTFAGCGAHVEQVLAGVPKSERCQCHERKSAPAEKPGADATTFWSRLFRP